MTKLKEKTVFILKDGIQFTVDGHAKPEDVVGFILEEEISEVADDILVHCYRAKIDELDVITKICEQHDFNVDVCEQSNGTYLELSQYTPLGEDWHEIIWFDKKTELNSKIYEHARNFDVSDAVEPFIEMRGQRGVPSSIKDLLEDAEWKKETLSKLAEDCLNAW